MVTVGKTETGRPIVKPLKPKAYFQTYNDAYAALIEFNKQPYDINNMMTMKDLYDEWFEKYQHTVSDATIRATKVSWERCESIYDLPVVQFKIRHCKNCLDQGPTYSTKANVKNLLSMMLDHAIDNEIIDKNYAKLTKIDKQVVRDAVQSRKSHLAFTDDEMNILWNNTEMPFVNMILIQCYSGWRPQELCLIKLKDVDLKEQTMTGGMKTSNGKNRTVPIHKKIKDLVASAYKFAESQQCEMLFPEMTYRKYQYRFEINMSNLKLNADHRPHDPRKTFVTMCKNANVDEYAIKRMVGHSISDLTESVYTTRNINWLRNELAKV